MDSESKMLSLSFDLFEFFFCYFRRLFSNFPVQKWMWMSENINFE